MDITILLYFQRFREITLGIFNSLFLYITTFGEDILLFLGSAGVYWCINKRAGFLMCFHYNLANYLNQFIKITVCVNRPWIRDSRIQPVAGAVGGAGGYSFPSGHTAKATAVWGSLGMSTRRQSKLISRFFFALVVLVGISRNYLGVHTPQDVMVSLGIGAVLLIGTERIIKRYDSQNEGVNRNWECWLCIFSIGLAIFLIFYASVKPYPIEYADGMPIVDPQTMIPGAYKGVGGLMGFSLGWLLEKKLVGFKTENYSGMEKITRFLYGSAGLVFILKVLPPLGYCFIDELAASILNGFVPAFYIVGVFPLAASVLEGKTHVRRKMR